MLDKKNLFANKSEWRDLHLELGCGPNKKNPDAIGIDAVDYPGVDLVGDIFEILLEFPNESVAAVSSYHFFEHIGDLTWLMSELGRVMKKDGLLLIVVPHFSNPYFYSDPTHRTTFGLYTFCYYTQSQIFSRRVPNYGTTFPFRQERVDLVFKSTIPFVFRHLIKKILGAIFNSTRYMREFYEENLTYLFPCYEIAYRLRKGAASE